MHNDNIAAGLLVIGIVMAAWWVLYTLVVSAFEWLTSPKTEEEAPPPKMFIAPDGTVMHQEHDRTGHPIPGKWFAVEQSAGPEPSKTKPRIVGLG